MIKSLKLFLKKVLVACGFDIRKLVERFSNYVIRLALAENGLASLVDQLRRIEPDISNQESRQKERQKGLFIEYWELKRRMLHAFQCTLMLRTLESLPFDNLTVVDIGDSAGTHMFYLKELTKHRLNIDTISVNLDPVAIEKIKARGQKAILCRAEDLNLGDRQVDLFTSFEIVEHLHNPAIFFRRLAERSNGNRILVTVPYLKHSRVGLHHIRNNVKKAVIAEEEHIFELSPKDWTLLMLHSGWRIVYSKIYYQYPKRWPIISQILTLYWRETDFEGFWGAILEKDTTFSNFYRDWEK